ncbi:MAG: Na+/H+ antiporter subunit E [Tissierellia bacterium]|jgi:multicomponent Na+:H+ antiporter subunit E|nr:Na+/H+ antiporter subunit E [Tissierellia bacterium]
MDKRGSLFQKKYIILALVLFLFWLILSSSFAIESVIMGLVASIAVTLYSKDIIFDEEETSLYKFSGLIQLVRFVWHLILEVVKANIGVVKIVLDPSLPISPRFVVVPIPDNLKKNFNKVLYANAITLTPGTLTVDILEEGYLIHALTQDAASGLKGSVLEEYVMKVEEA